MFKDKVQRVSEAQEAHLLLYDGVCGLCSALVQFVLKHDRLALFHFASLQSPAARTALAPFGKSPDQLETLYVLVGYRKPASRLLAKGRAALFIITRLNTPLRVLGGFVGMLPDALLDRAYDVISRNRYRVFGLQLSCLLPHPEFRDRFIDYEADTQEEMRFVVL